MNELSPPIRSSAPRAPVFVVGCPRSGTTVLGRALGAHSALVTADESILLRPLERFYSSLFQGRNPRRWAPLRDFISETDLLVSLGNLADAVFNSLVSRHSAHRYLDHTPWYVRIINFINILYPDAQFIHIIRDGRDVVISLAKAFADGFEWAGKTIAERATLWAGSVKAGKEAGRNLGPRRYCEVRYEDLCLRPDRTIEYCLSFLGLSMEDQTLLPLAAPHASPSRADCVLAVMENGRLVGIRPQLVGNKWPSGWAIADRDQFLRVGGPLLLECGYSL